MKYIGVTGLMSWRDSVELWTVLNHDGTGTCTVLDPPLPHLFMAGVLMTQQTLNGEPAKKPNRDPKREDVAHIFPNRPRSLNLIHYFTREQDTLYEQLERAREFGGSNCHGFQINVPWPDPKVIEAYQSKHSETLVIQCGRHAMEDIEYSPSLFASRLARYQGLAQYALVDLSCGHGVLLKPDTVFPFLCAVKHLGFEPVVAGGLCKDTVSTLVPLIEDFPDLSLDAESKIRDDKDRLIVVEGMRYIRAAAALFK